MNYTLTIGIVCVPKRLQMAKDLLNKINIPKHSFLCCDTEMKGSWYGTKLAWQKGLLQQTTHIMAIEEDVDVCDNFYETSIRAISIHPESIISFYSTSSEKNMCAWARKNNSIFYQSRGVPSGQCVIMPSMMVRKFLLFCDKWVDPKSKYEDQRLWGFMHFNHLTTFTVVPNLVQHIAPTQSTLGFNNKGKVSPDWIGNLSSSSLDWNTDKSDTKIFKPKVEVSRNNFIRSFLGTEEIPD